MRKLEVPFGRNLAYGIGEIADQLAYQGFTFTIFTFYYSVIKLDAKFITLVFIIWSIYNAFNDPLLGSLSDKTRTRKFFGGRRRPWMIVTALPLAVVMVLLFTSPGGQISGGLSVGTVIYMLFIMCLFDTIYTAYSINRTSLYPEIFRTDKAREEVGAVRRIVMVIALLVAFILPTLMIEDMTLSNPVPDVGKTIWQYQLTGIIFGVIILASIIINVLWGAKEAPYEELEKKETMNLWQSLKVSLSNKKFVIFALCSTMNWFVFGLIPTIMPIYVKTVVAEGSDFLYDKLASLGDLRISLPLVVAFLMSIFGVLFWSFIDRKLGSKLGFILSMSWWAAVLIPLIFIKSYLGITIIMALNGIGLGGSPYFIDRHISNIADDDEVKTGQRREGSYYGVHALFVRLSTILSIGAIALVLTTNGWAVYDPINPSEGVIFGLKSLMSLFPAGALLIGIIILIFYPIGRKQVQLLQANLQQNKTSEDNILEKKEDELS
ncbi:MAG: MFS transporter [Candidatus Heimdallarchaeota archaeon]|nr:MFS transporter [Candidatus Heimdallarchaeota archaeon]